MARGATGSYANRKKASDLSICKFVSGTTTVELLGTVRDVTVRNSAREIDVGAVKDTLEWVKGGRQRREADLEVATESAPVARSLVGQSGTLTHDVSGLSESISCILMDNEERLGGVDGAQTETFKIVLIV